MVKKLLVFIFILLCTKSIFAKDYVVVGISGFGTNRSAKNSQDSGAHNNLPYSGNIYKRIELVHNASNKEMLKVLNLFNCKNGKKRQNIGFLIMVNSWGARKANQLAKQFEKKCGEKVDAFYMIDGVSKPLGAYSKKPSANKCYNYYQTKGLVRGNEIIGCKNKNLTQKCGNAGGIECHILTEWEGTYMARSHMIDNFLSN
jgi:hypothetical protein